MRDTDLLARIGGEEFALYLAGASPAEAVAIAERLCSAAASLQLREQGEAVPVTVSIGLACVHSPGQAWSAWLGRADQALYEAKRMGRNRVVEHREAAG